MHFQGNGNLNINYIINCFEDFVEKNFISQKAYELENTRLQGTLLAFDKLIYVKDPTNAPKPWTLKQVIYSVPGSLFCHFFYGNFNFIFIKFLGFQTTGYIHLQDWKSQRVLF